MRRSKDNMLNPPAPEAAFLIDVFREFEKKSISYCVLRNYESLPYNLGSSDIDILVEAQKLEKTIELLIETARAHGGMRVSQFGQSVMTVCFMGKENGWWGMRWDIHSSLVYHEVSYYDSEAVLARARRHDMVWGASKEDSAMIALLKSYLPNGTCKESYVKDAIEAYQCDRERLHDIFARYYGERLARRWDELLMSEWSWEGAKRVVRSTLIRLEIIGFLKHPIRRMRKKTVMFHKRLRQIIQRPGIAVAFMGTDGSGKSTVIEGIRSPFERALHTRMVYEHLRPNLLLSLARLFGRPEPKGPVSNPHNSKPSGLLGSLMRLSYYSLDYVFGYWFKVFPVLVRRSTIWVFDRYFQDYLIDPRRSRLSLPQWLVKLYAFFIPRPDLILCLGADPEVVHARKEEIPLDEVRRQTRLLETFCRNEPRAIWIDTGGSVEESIDAVLEAITSHMAARYGTNGIMLDERSISWKVLLPNGPGDSVLTLGVDAGGLVGLARSWKHVECIGEQEVIETAREVLLDTPERIGAISSLEHCSGKYALIVVASPLEDETFSAERLADLLEPDGVMICLGFSGCDITARDLRRAGFRRVDYYAALSNRQPRVFFPISSSHLAAKGLAFHSPGSRLARWGIRVAKCLSRVGCRAHFRRGAVILARREKRERHEGSLSFFLSERLGYPIDVLIIYAGSDTPRRKITALAVAKGGREDMVVKIADTAPGAEAIQQESDALRALADTGLAPQIPRLIVERAESNGYTLQVQSAALSPGDKQTRTLSEQHIEFLAQLSAIGRTTKPLETTRQWRKLQTRIEKTDTASLPKSVIEAIAIIQSERCAKERVLCHRIHGDFTPWNIRRCQDRLFVVDWEDSDPDGLAFWDLFHFLYRQAALVGPWPGATRLSQVIRESASILCGATGSPQCDWTMIFHAWAVHEYLTSPSPRLVELLEFGLG